VFTDDTLEATNGIEEVSKEVEDQVIEDFKKMKIFQAFQTAINTAFNKNEAENKELKRLMNFQDDSTSPRTIDELFGPNFSKIRIELNKLLKMVQDKGIIFIRESKKDAEDKKLFEKMMTKLTKQMKELLSLNLNIEGSLLANLETLVYLNDFE
jgi:hypothetical protein